MHDPVTPEFLAAARGDAPADLVLAGARVVNVFSGEILTANVAIFAGRIASVGPNRQGRERLELNGAYLAPGFIDAHMHVESTMMPPSGFAQLAVPHGTTGVVLDPHEIANVLGIPGIRAIMDDARDLPIDAMFALSSCVPSCHLETSGAKLEASDLEPLFDDHRVVALAEMMNFPGVVNADPAVLAKVNLGLARRIVDGHAPGLTEHGLQAYAAARISSDHECTSPKEALEKLRLGLQIYIREGSAARNLDALLPLVSPATLSRFCFCTDDRHPADLQDEGHIDHIVRRAVAMGLDPVSAITIASFNTARHYNRRDLGAVAPGYRANLIIFDDLNDIRPRRIYFNGALAAADGEYFGPPSPSPVTLRARFPASHVRLPKGFSGESLAAPARSSSKQIRVIGMDPHQLVTESIVVEGRVENGRYVSDTERDILKLAVVERHTGSGAVGVGFVRGFGLKRGAIASTVGHDAHNLALLGTNDADMVAAARALADSGGGQCAVEGGKVLALLPLPIAGLMSDQPPRTVIAQQAALLNATRALGCPHHDPFMPLSFMPLPVIPHLKLSDQGLVDVDRFAVVPLEF